jgi:hypothetical protein
MANVTKGFSGPVAGELQQMPVSKCMKTFRVTFLERTGASGEPSERPTDYVAIDLADGVVRGKQFVERTAPSAMHSEDSLEEDDDFLSVGSETWDYEVADGREEEFIAALLNSQMVMEYVRLDGEPSPIEP